MRVFITGRIEVSPFTSIRMSIPTRALRLAAQATFNSLGRPFLRSVKIERLGGNIVRD